MLMSRAATSLLALVGGTLFLAAQAQQTPPSQFDEFINESTTLPPGSNGVSSGQGVPGQPVGVQPAGFDDGLGPGEVLPPETDADFPPGSNGVSSGQGVPGQPVGGPPAGFDDGLGPGEVLPPETDEDFPPVDPEFLDETDEDFPPVDPEFLDETDEDFPPVDPEFLDETDEDFPPVDPEFLDETGGIGDPEFDEEEFLNEQLEEEELMNEQLEAELEEEELLNAELEEQLEEQLLEEEELLNLDEEKFFDENEEDFPPIDQEFLDETGVDPEFDEEEFLDENKDFEDVDFVSDDYYAYQSGPDLGPSYAGAMSYDPLAEVLYVTGATYGLFGEEPDAPEASTTKGSCFVATLSARDLSEGLFELIGTSDKAEACTDIKVKNIADDLSLAMRVLGVAEAGGFLKDVIENDTPNSYHAFVLDMEPRTFEFEGLQVDDEILPDGLMSDPTALNICPNSGNTYVTTVTLQGSDVKPESREFPDLTRGGYCHTDNPTIMTVQMFFDDMTLGFSEPLDFGESWASYPGGIVKTPSGLIVVGTTRDTEDKKSGSVGFLAKVDKDFGEMDGPPILIYEPNGLDVVISQVCQDPNDENMIYFVGGTTGSLVEYLSPKDVSVKESFLMEPFVSKYDASNMTEIWTVQIPPVEDSDFGSGTALGCDVLLGPATLMYVAGIAEGGASFDSASSASTMHDQVFVVQLDTEFGEIYWSRQVGAADGGTYLASGGGIVAKTNGDAVIFGETLGHMFREEAVGVSTPKTSDIFIMTLTADGGYHKDLVATGVEDFGDFDDIFDSLNSTTTAVSIGWIIFLLVIMGLVGACAMYGIYRLSRQHHNRKAASGVGGMGRVNYEQVLTVDERDAANLAPADKDDFQDDLSATGLSRKL